MTLGEMLAVVRIHLHDTFQPYQFDDALLTFFLNEAQQQACMRGRLLLEDADPDMCLIAVEADRHTYPLHPKLYELTAARLKADGSSEVQKLKIVSRGWLDSHVCDWRDGAKWWGLGAERYLVQEESSVRIVPTPARDGVLTIEAHRLPLAEMLEAQDRPEIHEASHAALMDWALYRAFSIPNPDSYNQEQARLHEERFTAYFGLPVDADLRRITREDTPQTNRVYV